ncbi:MAG: rhodanese-like domain-containing protein [Bacteroidota bacterium]|nr:rhodanese-like domain-containing protein [Candidatus Kapabacteria bacterium]MCS7303402.1 rhodanese-like domain-containing protein [Candidatus Kapabacteria bacterium]MCX7937412.1 rhodanese-like domain-containing protein [Chlorobiota bacterium]MDW8075660.1 rhodanese-like domain-containing protein [Bacteroidota bacterium]MDW8272283.1 rhodanese-like domain-containing protein [Bacteroidota bacterium]
MLRCWAVAIALAVVPGGAQTKAPQLGTTGQQPRIHYHFPGEEDTLEFRYGFTVEETVELVRIDTQLVIVDIRSPQQYATEHLPGAVNVPTNTIKRQLKLFRGWEHQQRNMLLVSEDGQEARKWTSWLHQRGVSRVWYIRGGIRAWAAAGQPLERQGN